MVAILPTTDHEIAAACCAPELAPRLAHDALKQLTDDLAIVNHPIRLQILDMLAQREGQVCVCDLEAALPVKQPTVSHHLKLLREAGLIDCERRGLWAHYFIRRDAVQQLRNRILSSFDCIC
ncbi:helix-turn-helix transcriptional regulator [Candidatus Gracilibacteria bacterium]|nr:helix-turn-helix transcriptional regulator [Candidatus Gracilibacteria bacterium]